MTSLVLNNWALEFQQDHLTTESVQSPSEILTILFIPTLDTTTKFVIMTISMSQGRRLSSNN